MIELSVKEMTRLKEKLKDVLIMSLGTLIMAVGIYFFKIPNGFATGGISGIATILGRVQPYLTPGQLIPILNIIMLIIGFIFLGRETGIKTVYCSLLLSLTTFLLEKFIPLASPLTNQPFLELIYGVLLAAIGSAILFNRQASSGGTDITALILKKFTSLDVGKALLAVDLIVAGSSFFVYNLATGLFSLLGLFIKAFLVDNVIESFNECKSFTIVTDKPEKIVDYIINTMHHSATSVDAVGEYTHTGKKMIVTLCKRIEAVRLKRYIRTVDPHAFVIVNSTSEIIGRGFRSI